MATLNELLAGFTDMTTGAASVKQGDTVFTVRFFRGTVVVTAWPDEETGLHRGHFEPDEEERTLPLQELFTKYRERLAPVKVYDRLELPLGE